MLKRPGHFIFFLAAIAAALYIPSVKQASAAEPKPKPQTQREDLTIDMTTVNRPWKGDLDGIAERHFLRVLTVYSKTFYFVEKGVQKGGTYDIFMQFEKDLNEKLARQNKLKHKNFKVKVVFIPVNRDELIPMLEAGKGDIAAGNITVTPSRRETVDFSAPVYPGVSEVIVSGPGSPPVASLDDLSGKDVFVRRSSSYYESLEALNKRFASERKPGVNIRLAPESLEDEDLIEMAGAGLMPLIVVDKHIADFWKQVFPKITIHPDITVRTGADIAWAMRKQCPQLKAAVDDFIKRNGKGTMIGNTILARYFKSANYVKNAASEAERKKFQALIEYFKKYGDKYDVDWLLMAAQGYQESQLDQAVRSKVGAIGVMQVMPSTAKELQVGDINEVEANIHAGIKYMRYMIDQYYGSEPMTKLDKALFAFASYNAGPARIASLRKEASARGLDPNVWFGNVERVAADKIGPETVTYVSNIFKYYIAYNLLIEANEKRQKDAKEFKGM